MLVPLVGWIRPVLRVATVCTLLSTGHPRTHATLQSSTHTASFGIDTHPMFTFDDLCFERNVEGESVQCPVRGCASRVPVQRRTFRRSSEFLCPAHRVYIGRSTFEYEFEASNLVSHAPEDQQLLAAIRPFKRESRMARERSEDALTWNVFRHLETSGRLESWLGALAGVKTSSPAVHYWSFDSTSRDTWKPLTEARAAFLELDGRGSEPDLVITTADAHIWVEAKLGSSNSTTPSDVDGSTFRYTRGGDAWYSSVVGSPFETVAVEGRRYELLRLWLLGSWAAARHRKTFVLVNLVREGLEEDIPSFAATHFTQSTDRLVRRVTWESLYRSIETAPPHSVSDAELLHYMRGKTLGYDTRGRLVRAFALEREARAAAGRSPG